MSFETWIRQRFYWDNHKKYLKYFDEWFSNLTNGQIDGFRKQYNHLVSIGKENCRDICG